MDTSDQTLFRPTISKLSEEPKVEPQGEVKTETDGKPVDMPPSLYQEARRVPYILSILETPEVFKQFDYGIKTREIDAFINSEVKRSGLPDTRESYKKVYESLLKQVKDPESVYTILDQILEWSRIQSKLISVAKEKEDFLKKPIEKMSVAELRKAINESR